MEVLLGRLSDLKEKMSAAQAVAEENPQPAAFITFRCPLHLQVPHCRGLGEASVCCVYPLVLLLTPRCRNPAVETPLLKPCR
jgi:hypothetical protein